MHTCVRCFVILILVFQSNYSQQYWWKKIGPPFSVSTVDSRGVMYSVIGGGYQPVDTWIPAVIMHSTNNGSDWNTIASWHSDNVRVVLGVDDNVFGITWHNYSRMQSSIGVGVSQSNDYGQTWKSLKLMIVATSIIQLSKKTIFIGTISAGEAADFVPGLGVLKSIDGGLSWDSKNNGLTTIEVLSLSAINADTLVALTSDGVFTTFNGGDLWQKKEGVIPEKSMALLTDNTNNIFCLTMNRTVWKSSLDGLTWELLKNNADSIFTAFCPVPDGKLFVSQSKNGIFQSTDHGSTWVTMSDGLPKTILWKLIYGRNQHLYAVSDSGIYQFEQKITETDAISFKSINSYSLSQNYPNPFNPSTQIRFTLPATADKQGSRQGGQEGFTSLKVYDLLGREVATLVNENLQPGSHQATWNAAGFANGIYFYQLTAGPYRETKRMLLLK